MVHYVFICCPLQPSEYLGSIPPDSDASFQLFDRVINVKLNMAVPFGLRGTVIGFHQGTYFTHDSSFMDLLLLCKARTHANRVVPRVLNRVALPSCCGLLLQFASLIPDDRDILK